MTGVPRPICIRGHNKDIEGRDKSGWCNKCRRMNYEERYQIYRDQHKGKGRKPRKIETLNQGMLSLAPLEELMRTRMATGYAFPDSLQRQLYRGRERGGLTYKQADAFACYFRLNPTALWGDEFFGDIPMEEHA